MRPRSGWSGTHRCRASTCWPVSRYPILRRGRPRVLATLAPTFAPLVDPTERVPAPVSAVVAGKADERALVGPGRRRTLQVKCGFCGDRRAAAQRSQCAALWPQAQRPCENIDGSVAPAETIDLCQALSGPVARCRDRAGVRSLNVPVLESVSRGGDCRFGVLSAIEPALTNVPPLARISPLVQEIIPWFTTDPALNLPCPPGSLETCTRLDEQHAGAGPGPTRPP